MEKKTKKNDDVFKYFFCRNCKMLDAMPRQKSRVCKCGSVLKLKIADFSKLPTMGKFMNDLKRNGGACNG